MIGYEGSPERYASFGAVSVRYIAILYSPLPCLAVTTLYGSGASCSYAVRWHPKLSMNNKVLCKEYLFKRYYVENTYLFRENYEPISL